MLQHFGLTNIFTLVFVVSLLLVHELSKPFYIRALALFVSTLIRPHNALAKQGPDDYYTKPDLRHLPPAVVNLQQKINALVYRPRKSRNYKISALTLEHTKLAPCCCHLPLESHEVLFPIGLEMDNLAPGRAFLELLVGRADRFLHRRQDLMSRSGWEGAKRVRADRVCTLVVSRGFVCTW